MQFFGTRELKKGVTSVITGCDDREKNQRSWQGCVRTYIQKNKYHTLIHGDDIYKIRRTASHY